jgi:hypothetical protein
MPDGDPPRLEAVRLLWHFGFWDGPINGVATYNGRHYWFEAEPFDQEDEPSHSRRYFLYDLTDEAVAEERCWHERFPDLVGTHT